MKNTNFLFSLKACRAAQIVIVSLLLTGASTPAARCDEAGDLKSWQALKQRVEPQEKTDAKAAIAQYRQFLDAPKGVAPSVAIEAASAIAQLWGQLKDTTKALETYEQAYGLYREHPNASRLQSEKTDLLLSLFNSGVLKPQVAWQNGQLQLDDVIFLLERKPLTNEQRPLFVELLAKNGGQRILPPDGKPTLSSRILQEVGEYWNAKRDVRAIAIYQFLLTVAETDGQRANHLHGLADAYQKQDRKREAAETLLRVAPYVVEKFAGWAASVHIEAARLYGELGEQERAQQYYEKAKTYGHGWTTGMATWEQAGDLMAQGKHDEARRLLSTPLMGEEAEQIRVLMLSRLALSHYRTGEFDAAKPYAQQAVAQFELLTNPLKDHGLEGAVSEAQGLLMWMERWDKTPVKVVVEPQQVRLYIRPATTDAAGNVQAGREVVKAQVAVRSFWPMQPDASTPDARLQMRAVKLPPDAVKTAFFYQTIFEIEVKPEARGESFEAKLTVRDPKRPQWQVEVPISFEVVKPEN